MPQTVEIPGQGIAEFPDEMSPDAIKGVIKSKFFPDASAAESKPAAKFNLREQVGLGPANPERVPDGPVRPQPGDEPQSFPEFLANPTGAMEQVGGFEPAVKIPRIKQQEGVLKQTGAAIANTAAGAAESVTSPAGLPALLGGLESKGASRLMGLIFAPSLITGGIKTAMAAPTLQGKLEGGLQAALGGLGAVHAATETKGAIENISPEASLAPETAKAVTETPPVPAPEPIKTVPAPASDLAPASADAITPEAGTRIVGPEIAGVRGVIGETHADLIKKALGTPNEDAALTADDSQHLFHDDKGNLLNREEAAKVAVAAGQVPEGTTSLQSEMLKAPEAATDAPALVETSAPRTPEGKPRVFRGPADAFGSEVTPVASSLIDSGGLLSKSGARKAGRFAGKEELWDGSGDILAHPTHNKIYSLTGEPPDAAAQALFDQGLINDPSPDAMYAALRRESQNARTLGKEQANFAASEAAAHSEWHEQLKDREADPVIQLMTSDGEGAAMITRAENGDGIELNTLGSKGETVATSKHETLDAALRAAHAQGLQLDEGSQAGKPIFDETAPATGAGDSQKTGETVPAPRETPAESATGAAPEVASAPPASERPLTEPNAPQQPTGIRNAVVDAQRVQRGLPARMEPLRKTNPEAWDAAMRVIDRNANAGRELVTEIGDRPRALTPEDSALLAHETVTRENAFDNAVEDVNNAKTPEEIAAAKQRLDLARNDVHELYDAGQRAGTQSGQSLQARKMMVNQDYSLAKMEAITRAIANDGKPLSEAQLAEVKTAHDKIAELQAKLDAHESGTANAELAKYFDQLLKETRTEAKSSASKGKSLTDFLGEQEQKARQRIIDRRGRLQVTVDPLNVAGLVDEAIIGASHIARGLKEIGAWSEQMIKDFGERIRPYLDQLYDRAKKYHDAHAALFTGDKNSREGVLSKIKADSLDKLTQRDVYNLARSHVNEGVTDLGEVMQAVTKDLQDKIPGISEREVRDKFSEYGKLRVPSKETDLVALRDLRRQAQLVSALEDAQRGEAPKKTGAQRDKPSDKVRELQRQVIDAMQENGIETLDPEKQLASNLQRFKTGLRNRTADLKKKLAAGDYTRRTRAETQMDNEVTRLKDEHARVKQKFEEGLEKARLAKRPFWVKAFTEITEVARMSALSGYHTLAKIAGYDAFKFIETPITEMTGAVLSKVPGYKGIAKSATLEHGSTIAALRDFYVAAGTEGMKEAWRVITTGKTSAKAMFGKPDYSPPKWQHFFGNLHMAEKAPMLTGTMKMYYRRAYDAAIKAGLDPSQDFVQAAINKEVYDYSQKAILQENNTFSDAVNGWQKRAEMENPKTGQVDITKATLSMLVKTFLTKGIIKTPANYIKQTIQRTPVGLGMGLVKVGMAKYRGVDALHPVEANAIANLIKVGSVGSAFFIWGAIDGTKEEKDRVFGGYYQPGRKRGGDDVDWGKIRVEGKQLPHLLTHNPLTESAQMGSTMMRVALSRLRASDEQPQGIAEGTVRAVIALGSQAPIANPLMRAGSQRGSATGDLLGGLVPQLLRNIAEDTDTADKRVPRGAIDNFKAGVPGLREQVPERGIAVKPFSIRKKRSTIKTGRVRQ